LAQRYCDEVANPMDMILFRKRKTGDKGKRIIEDEIDDPDDITELFEGDVRKQHSFLIKLILFHFSIAWSFSFYRKEKIGLVQCKEELKNILIWKKIKIS